MSLKIECHSKYNVTQIKWNVTQNGMSIKINANQNSMSPKLECHSKWNVTQN